jgi:hypothetical protein
MSRFASDVVSVHDQATTSVSTGRFASDLLSVHDRATAAIVELGPVVVRTHASSEMKVIRSGGHVEVRVPQAEAERARYMWLMTSAAFMGFVGNTVGDAPGALIGAAIGWGWGEYKFREGDSP